VSKSSFSLTFDKFSLKLYDNNKQYMNMPLDTSTAGIHILTQMKEQTVEENTGFINSLIIIKTAIQS